MILRKLAVGIVLGTIVAAMIVASGMVMFDHPAEVAPERGTAGAAS